MEEEKTCKNCRNYAVHYVKVDNYLLQLSTGHCANVKLFPRIKDRNKIVSNCQFWESIEIQKAERKKTIKQVLRDMEKSLRDIEAILQSDED